MCVRGGGMKENQKAQTSVRKTTEQPFFVLLHRSIFWLFGFLHSLARSLLLTFGGLFLSLLAWRGARTRGKRRKRKMPVHPVSSPRKARLRARPPPPPLSPPHTLHKTAGLSLPSLFSCSFSLRMYLYAHYPTLPYALLFPYPHTE